MKRILILTGFLVFGLTVFSQEIRKTQVELTDTLATHIEYTNWIDFIEAYGGGGTASPLTTKGDLYTYTTVDARLPVGTDGQVLKANSATSTGLQWADESGGTPTRQTLTSSASITFDYDNGSWAKLTIATNATLTFQDFPDFAEGWLEITQDATGSRTITFAENITAVTDIQYSGGLENIQPTASTVTRVRYTIDDDVLYLEIGWYE